MEYHNTWESRSVTYLNISKILDCWMECEGMFSHESLHYISKYKHLFYTVIEILYTIFIFLSYFHSYDEPWWVSTFNTKQMPCIMTNYFCMKVMPVLFQLYKKKSFQECKSWLCWKTWSRKWNNVNPEKKHPSLKLKFKENIKYSATESWT